MEKSIFSEFTKSLFGMTDLLIRTQYLIRQLPIDEYQVPFNRTCRRIGLKRKKLSVDIVRGVHQERILLSEDSHV